MSIIDSMMFKARTSKTYCKFHRVPMYKDAQAKSAPVCSALHRSLTAVDYKVPNKSLSTPAGNSFRAQFVADKTQELETLLV